MTSDDPRPSETRALGNIKPDITVVRVRQALILSGLETSLSLYHSIIVVADVLINFKMRHLNIIAAVLLLARATTASTVTPSKTCYLANENFVVSFTDSSPQSGDTVQIVASGATNELLSQATCSGFFCLFSVPKSGSITFTERLSAGNYQALLRRGSSFFSSSSTILATSATFRLVGSGQTCISTSPPPTKAPTLNPTPPPTKAPILPPSPSTPTTINDLASQVLTQARAVIAGLVQSNARLTPEFIRMGFHDCIHVCDGKSIQIVQAFLIVVSDDVLRKSIVLFPRLH
jgi:hypothetical protein